MLAAALLLIAQVAATPVPSAEAEALGLRLAHTGVLATALPLAGASSVENLVSQHPDLSDADKAALRRTASAVAVRETDRVLAQEGHQYATLLSIEDLRTLVAGAETAAAQRQRAILPRVIAGTMQAMGSIDIGQIAWTEFCGLPGRQCPATR